MRLKAGDGRITVKKVTDVKPRRSSRDGAGPMVGVKGLLWRDDLDTAFRHLDLYDRFGCPTGHIQATFRCVVRQGSIDPKATDTLNSRVHTCWLNPTIELQGTTKVPSGTTSR
jgi:hypothetical protein